jgi:hypothetical protein
MSTLRFTEFVLNESGKILSIVDWDALEELCMSLKKYDYLPTNAREWKKFIDELEWYTNQIDSAHAGKQCKIWDRAMDKQFPYKRSPREFIDDHKMKNKDVELAFAKAHLPTSTIRHIVSHGRDCIANSVNTSPDIPCTSDFKNGVLNVSIDMEKLLEYSKNNKGYPFRFFKDLKTKYKIKNGGVNSIRIEFTKLSDAVGFDPYDFNEIYGLYGYFYCDDIKVSPLMVTVDKDSTWDPEYRIDQEKYYNIEKVFDDFYSGTDNVVVFVIDSEDTGLVTKVIEKPLGDIMMAQSKQKARSLTLKDLGIGTTAKKKIFK